MRSAKAEAVPRGASLARRFILVAGASATVGAAVAVAVCVFTIDRVLADQVDQRLRGACVVLAGELLEEAEEGDSSMVEVLDDENSELVQSGIRLAVYRGRELVAGDPWVPKAGGVRCISRGELGHRVRACGLDFEGDRLVAAQLQDEGGALTTAYLSAALAALVVAAGLAALSSVMLGRWTLRPLSNLVARVRSLSEGAPDPAELGGPLPVNELEALRGALSEALARTRDHLTHAERFSADAAHQLLTPMSILRAELDLLAEDSTGDTRQRITALAERTAALSALVKRLLVLSTPGRMEGDLPLVSLAQVAEDVLNGLSNEQRPRVEFEEASEGLLLGDESLLRALVQNLVENALVYSEGPVQVRVFGDTAAGSPRVGVEVRDFGTGIAPELRERVFEPFFRIRSHIPGHGIGLAVVRRIVDAHGGSVAISDASPGTRVSATFARAPESAKS